MTQRPATLITGASSGIGAALAALFAREPGRVLVLAARRTAPMEVLARELQSRYGTESVVLAADLEQAGAAGRLLAEIAARGL
ncbi:MAG: SDR family NAD(P)-dependent oxidoreductase, partial [Perlucidibaca sp.]